MLCRRPNAIVLVHPRGAQGEGIWCGHTPVCLHTAHTLLLVSFSIVHSTASVRDTRVSHLEFLFIVPRWRALFGDEKKSKSTCFCTLYKQTRAQVYNDKAKAGHTYGCVYSIYTYMLYEKVSRVNKSDIGSVLAISIYKIIWTQKLCLLTHLTMFVPLQLPGLKKLILNTYDIKNASQQFN